MADSLFGNFDEQFESVQKDLASQIRGLEVVRDFVSADEEQELVNSIDSSLWLDDLSRRVQHYGYKYDYRARRIDISMRIGQLPDWCLPIATRLVERSFFPRVPDQVIVNEYLPGQGIAPHIDCKPCFEDTIVSLSLGSAVVMEFEKEDVVVPVILPVRSAIVLKDESRFEWKHGISKRKSDFVNGKRIRRDRRISLTFRLVIL